MKNSNKTNIKLWASKWEDQNDEFSKWDFYGKIFDLIEDKKVSYKTISDISGVKIGIIKMRIRDMRQFCSKVELLKIRKDRKSQQFIAWCEIYEAVSSVTPRNENEAGVINTHLETVRAKMIKAEKAFLAALSRYELVQ